MYGKYHLYKKQLSWDSGATWYDSDPLVTVITGDPVATYETYEQCTGETPKEKIVLFEGSQSFAQWDVARFSKSEGFLQEYFEHDMNEIMDYLYNNNEPLYVEFSSVPDSGTLCLQDGSWTTIFDPALPVSTSEPLQIYITDNTMYNVIYTHDLALIDKASNGFTITKVYYYE